MTTYCLDCNKKQAENASRSYRALTRSSEWWWHIQVPEFSYRCLLPPQTLLPPGREERPTKPRINVAKSMPGCWLRQRPLPSRPADGRWCPVRWPVRTGARQPSDRALPPRSRAEVGPCSRSSHRHRCHFRQWYYRSRSLGALQHGAPSPIGIYLKTPSELRAAAFPPCCVPPSKSTRLAALHRRIASRMRSGCFARLARKKFARSRDSNVF